MELLDQDRKVLEKILQLGRQIERVTEPPLPEEELGQIILLLGQLSTSPNPAVQKLAEIQDHLHPNMKLQSFSYFLVPIERLLNRSPRDEQFLVYEHELAAQTDKNENLKKQNCIVVLDNIRSSFNVGSIFRSADCFSIQAVYLCGYTPTPEDLQLQKTSMNTHEWVDFKHFKSIDLALEELKKNQYHIYAIEKSKVSKNIFETKFAEKSAFVFGNERFGLDPQVLNACDTAIEIPLLGRKNSLNVASTLSCVLFEYSRQMLQNP